jgi:3-hydroxybutyryl-CoA dehydrogenase
MKNINDIRKIAVVGAGTMGLGIAQVFAQSGFKVILFDLNQIILEKAKIIIDKNLTKAVESKRITEENKKDTWSRLHFTIQFNELKADLIVEAIIEKLEVKQQLFHDLATQNDSNTIFASNTSSIPITQIAHGIPNEERVVGMHFFNPAHIMKLVEVISGANTHTDTANSIFQLAQKIAKTPVHAKDAPGFIVNRVARHYYVEALKSLEEQVATLETIDKQMESLGFKMGPFKLMDLIGVDTNFSVTSSMFNSFHQDAKFRPSRIQKQKVDAGHHGIKSKKGFYSYP